VDRIWERAVLALVVLVPVPALALSGLAVPLPSVVERVAAALVPFSGEPVLENGSAFSAGRIVYTATSTATAEGARRGTRAASPPRRADTAARTPRISAGKMAPSARARATITTGTTIDEPPTTVPEHEAPASLDPTPAPAPAPQDERKPQRNEPGQTDVDVQPTKTPSLSTEPVAVIDTTPTLDPVDTSPQELVTETSLDGTLKDVEEAVDSTRDLVLRPEA
jgi:hypothetical protein